VKKRRGISKYEKSFDNRCAALVSRERRALRAGDERKSFSFKTLESSSCPSNSAPRAGVARRAQP
jgi:hypothetical protein